MRQFNILEWLQAKSMFWVSLTYHAIIAVSATDALTHRLVFVEQWYNGVRFLIYKLQMLKSISDNILCYLCVLI